MNVYVLKLKNMQGTAVHLLCRSLILYHSELKDIIQSYYSIK